MGKRVFRNITSLCAGLTLPILLTATGCAYQRVAETDPVPYVCKESTGAIIIDGNIDEVAWKTANMITNFYAYSPKDAAVLSPTEARILWDNRNLYVAITCSDMDIWSLSDHVDDQLWRGDAAEFFVKPDRDSLAYYEFVIAPNGTLCDIRHSSRGAGGYYRFNSWSSNMRVKSIINGTDGDGSDLDVGYTVEMAIPLSAFHGSTPPADGVSWTFGVFRYDFSKLFEEPLLLMSIPESKRGFHYYEGYADLVFDGAEGSGVVEGR